MKKLPFLKILSLLTAILILCALMAACNSDGADADGSGSTDSSSDTAPSINVDGLLVFGNEEYACSVIRSEMPSSVDGNTYNEIRKILKTATGKNCSIKTDFVGMGETLDKDIPAILVGDTDYPESKQVYEKLAHGEYRIEMVGNKLVIAYTSEDTANLAIKKFRGLVASSYKGGVLAVTESWNSSERLESKVEGLPDFIGSGFGEFDAGDGSELLVYKDVSKAAHDDFINGFEALGYELYTTNEIGNNLFYTYHNDESIINVMYLPNIEQTRVVIDTKEFTSLAGLESENIYEEGSSEMSFTQLGLEHPKAGNCQNGMGYILKLSDGSFVIVDGGHTRDMSYAESAGDYLLDSLKVLADDPNDIRVHTWFLSHIHNDHIGAFYDIARDTPDSIKVERLVYNAPNDTQLAGVSGGNLDDKVENAAKMFGIKTVVKGHPGQVFYANEATFTIYGSLDLVEPITIDNINESSMVMKMEFMGKTMIFLGDCHPNASLALTNAYGDDLKSNFIQLSHHGYADGATLLLNETIRAEASFWPVGNDHYKNMVSKIGAVPQNAPFVNIPHYVAGDTNLTIKDFDTWIPEEKRWTPYD